MTAFPENVQAPGPQSKVAILDKAGVQPLVVSVPTAAAMVGLSENSALPLFRERNVPILTVGKQRRVIRVADIERLLDELAKEAL